MTTKVFKKKLEKIIENSGEFIVWNSETAPYLSKDQFIVAGKDENETFTFEIIKVK